MGGVGQTLDDRAKRLRVRFVGRAASGDVVLLAFDDPATSFAIQVEGPMESIGDDAEGTRGDVLDVVLLPLLGAAQAATNRGPADWLGTTNDPRAASPIFIKYRGVELVWRPREAALQCDSEQADALLAALVEFSHYERELRRIEEEIAKGWAELEQDKALAFEVRASDLERSDIVGGRMGRVLQQRIRYARIEPHLYEPAATLTAAAQKLGAELRERARIEARLETVDAQIEVFEGVYEMCSQRMGEFRAAREEHVLEWVIIVLLAAEAFLMLAQTVWKLRA
jgi:hypothetical protein